MCPIPSNSITEKMEQFLDSNDGLRRCFDRHIRFEDYNPTELMAISELMVRKMGYILDSSAEDISSVINK